MKTNYYILFAIFLICLVLRAIYEILKKAGKINPKSKPLFMVILFVMCLLWISWFAMCPQDPFKIAFPSMAHWLGLGIFVVGMGLALGALFQLRGVENIDHLVTRGLFSKLRHPMYLGFIFWIIGWAIYHGAGLSLMVGFIGIGNVLYWRSLEENHLEKTYEEKYREYRKRTWF
jgi:protein-S-isoprenylcysteine O-methyltransferase Ste14